MISIIVPVYNIENSLSCCIESILSQTYYDFELLMIDDGSTDLSGVICEQYQMKDNRIKVFHKENGGVCSARNMGITASVGEYICFIDGDDSVEPTLLELLYNNCIEHNADFSFSSLRFCYLDGTINSRNYTGKEEVYTSTRLAKSFFVDEYLKQDLYGPYNKLFSTKVLEKIRFKENLSVGEDLLFVFQVLTQLSTIVRIDIPLYNYIKRVNSASTSAFSEKNIEYVEACSIIKDLCKEKFPTIYPEAEKWFFSIVANHYYLLNENKSVKYEVYEKYLSYKKYLKKNLKLLKNCDYKVRIQLFLAIFFPYVCPFVKIIRMLR